MRTIITAISGLWLLLAGALWVGDNPVVLELYTSQGCSSCPPADAALRELAARDDVIALALHVDYWDYLGWTDEFADPAFTKRQKAYARAAGKNMVYTPQMVIAGVDHVIGNKPGEVAELIRKHRAEDSGIALTISRQSGKVTIRGQASAPSEKPMLVQLVRYHDGQTVAIKRGENAGRKIAYSNIVTRWQVLERWDGRWPLSISADAPGDEAVVVIVQSAGHGPVLAAARLR